MSGGWKKREYPRDFMDWFGLILTIGFWGFVAVLMICLLGSFFGASWKFLTCITGGDC